MNMSPPTPAPLPPRPELRPGAYGRYMRALDWLRQGLGLRLHLKGSPEHLKTGHIFIFNHFTRFETAVPPYLIFKETGVVARTVADRKLFSLNPAFTRFLYDVGGVPNNLPGLLPYLAKEIFHGRKVVIFPEGGLVKDKQVFDARGEYGVWSGHAGAARKHHRGAAVLASYLDALKAFLREAEQRGDSANLSHWQTELELPSLEALRAAIAEPTLVVPSTLTFFPIRGETNALRRLTESLLGELPPAARDELTLETNLLLRPTDLDVWVGAPLATQWAPPRAEKMLWRHALRRISTLEQLFALELGQTGWLRAPLEHRLNATVNRLRDRAMRALYGGLTVNIHHVLAVLVEDYRAHGRDHVPAPEFEAALLWAAHRLQQQAARHVALPLHATLQGPEALLALAMGRHATAAKFLETLRRAKLVKRRDGAYHLSHALADVIARDEIRLENPVRLHANEAAVQPAVGLAVRWGVQQAAQQGTAAGARAWAELIVQAQREAAAAAHAAAGENALAAGAAMVAPFVRHPKPEQANGKGVLLLHGLGATPAQVKPLARELTALGYTVHAPMLPGHGSIPAALHGLTETDWLAAAELGLRVLQAQGLQELRVLGFSTGALLALQLGLRHPELLHGVVAVAPPFHLASLWRHLLRPARLVNALVGTTLGRLWPALRHGVVPFHRLNPAYPAEQYNRVPLGTVVALQRLARQTLRMLKPERLPFVTLVHGTADLTATYQGSVAALRQLGQGARLHPLRGAGHDLIRTNTAHSWAYVLHALQHGPASAEETTS